ncbi:hypothetical protein PIB30_092165 [Stylosanthes scabra]|uniref:Uncharacterized protein n=1 Tax=Stylosanthes scabra TaxID=79078 RepID=A0ABU6ZTD4_9FABA|nr:hypothetical protein [Stylosanthes scabra]
MEDLSMFQRPRTIALEYEKPETYGRVSNSTNSDPASHLIAKKEQQEAHHKEHMEFKLEIVKVETRNKSKHAYNAWAMPQIKLELEYYESWAKRHAAKEQLRVQEWRAQSSN